MANTGAKITLSGDKELQKLFEELPRRILKKGLRQAISAGATPIVKSAKSKVTKETGLLKKSIKKKLRTYSSGNVVAVIGADRSVAGSTTTKSGKIKKRVPANYIHLVEKGHAGPHPAPAYPFLEPAFDEKKDTAIDIASKKLKAVVEAEAAKLAAKGGK